MTSSPITSWEIDGETLEAVADFNFLGFKIISAMVTTWLKMVTAAMKLKDACSLEEKL